MTTDLYTKYIRKTYSALVRRQLNFLKGKLCNRLSAKEDIQITNKHFKGYSTLSVINQIQIKAPIGYN